jgi:ubiquinone/menaquinone biosynthesis C-methylase UbiE
MTQRQRPRPDPFRAYGLTTARRYEAWYHTPAGRAIAAEEQRALAAMLATLPPPQSLLEVGCGTGHFTRWFAARGGVVVGADPSPGMLAAASTANGGCCYVRATAEALPFADASIDIVAFITTLEFVALPTRALREAARVARSGVVLGVLNLASPLGLGRKLASWFRPSVYRSAHFYTAWGLQRLVRRSLPGRVQNMQWTTALWPRGVPGALRGLPCGALIALAARLAEPKEGAVPCST